MLKKVQRIILVLALSVGLAAPVLAPATTYAEATGVSQNFCSGANNAATGGGGSNTSCDTGNVAPKEKIKNLSSKIVDIFSIVVGAVAIIMIIYGGFRYITSGGDTNRVTSAKNTLLYAIIGIVIVALAQLIVHFFFTVATTSTN